MPGPNSAPNGDAGLVRGYPREEFVCIGGDKDNFPKGHQHVCGKFAWDYCIMRSRRLVGRVITGKTAVRG